MTFSVAGEPIVVVRDRDGTIRLHVHGDHGAELTVEDEGPGIRAEDLRSLSIIYDMTPGELTDQLIEAISAPITLGGSVEGLRVVTSGLKSGDRVVVNGLQRLRPGALVKTEVAEMGVRGSQRASADDNQHVAQR